MASLPPYHPSETTPDLPPAPPAPARPLPPSGGPVPGPVARPAAGPVPPPGPRPAHGPPVQADQPPAQRGGFDLKPTQLAGGALAAVTTAVAASYFGVGGTITGAAFGSVMSSVASAVYVASLGHASRRIRTVVVAPAAGRGGTGVADPGDPTAVPGDLTGATAPVVDAGTVRPARPAPGETHQPDGRAWPTLPVPATGPYAPGGPQGTPLGGAPQGAPGGRRSRRFARPAIVLGGFAFVASLAAISGTEAFLGHPIGDPGSNGVSVVRVFVPAGTSSGRAPAPAPSGSPSPSGSATPSGSPSGSDGGSPSPSASPTDPSAADPSPGVPGAGATPSDPGPSGGNRGTQDPPATGDPGAGSAGVPTPTAP